MLLVTCTLVAFVVIWVPFPVRFLVAFLLFWIGIAWPERTTVGLDAFAIGIRDEWLPTNAFAHWLGTVNTHDTSVRNPIT